MSEDKKGIRTKRRYAYELYPHATEEDESRLLEVEVPYLYAKAIGFEVQGTNWMRRDINRSEANNRMLLMIAARGEAFLVDALLQGLAGQEAWDWANVRNTPEGGEWVWERAVHYGVDPDAIKPYECGGEPDHHDHVDAADERGWRTVHRVEGKESACFECCEVSS